MKKLLFGLIATATLSIATFGQTVKPSNKISTSVSLSAKYHAVITYLESKDYYRAGMSSEEFVSKSLVGVTDQKLIDIFTPYMRTIYAFQTQKLTPDQVYDKINGDEFAKTVNLLRIYQEQTGNGATSMRIRWLNAIRKFIDWVDDTFGEAIDGPKAP